MNSNNSYKKAWLNYKTKYSAKELIINGFQVMQSWEDPYMKDLASVATKNGGDILELGFGMGISSGYIQKSKKLKKHFIIDCHPGVVRKAQKMFGEQISNGRLILIQSFWEDIVSKFKENSFDGILFDTGPIDKETEFFHFFPFFKEAFRLLKKGGVFTYFSDEPLGFSKQHLDKLESSGFKKIDSRICKVNPPETCRYWKHKTILTPIITK